MEKMKLGTTEAVVEGSSGRGKQRRTARKELAQQNI
jgi:hypothetical protein